MEAEKSYYLSSASWTPKKAGGVIQSESKGINPNLRAGEDEMKCPTQAVKQEKRCRFCLPLSFFLFLTLDGLDEAHHTGEGSLLQPPAKMLILHRSTVTDTSRNTV